MVITENFFCVIFEIVYPWNFFYVDLQCPLIPPLYWQRINDGYSTMNNGIFLIVHRTFLFSYFRGCWLLDFFCAQTEVCGHITKRLSSWLRLFLSNDYNIMALSLN